MRQGVHSGFRNVLLNQLLKRPERRSVKRSGPNRRIRRRRYRKTPDPRRRWMLATGRARTPASYFEKQNKTVNIPKLLAVAPGPDSVPASRGPVAALLLGVSQTRRSGR